LTLGVASPIVDHSTIVNIIPSSGTVAEGGILVDDLHLPRPADQPVARTLDEERTDGRAATGRSSA